MPSFPDYRARILTMLGKDSPDLCCYEIGFDGGGDRTHGSPVILGRIRNDKG